MPEPEQAGRILGRMYGEQQSSKDSPNQEDPISMLDPPNRIAFEKFWERYPKKVNRENAIKEWRRLGLRKGDETSRKRCKRIYTEAEQWHDCAWILGMENVPPPDEWLYKRMFEGDGMNKLEAILRQKRLEEEARQVAKQTEDVMEEDKVESYEHVNTIEDVDDVDDDEEGEWHNLW